MTRPRNYRVFSLLGILLAAALILLLFEHRPSFLRPGLRLSAYITTSDGSLTVVDLVKLRATAHTPIGQKLSGVREHPTRPEIWGVSTAEGFVWVLDTRTNQVTAKIPVGPLSYAVDFSPDGARAYMTSSGNNTLVAIVALHDAATLALRGTIPVVARPEDIAIMADSSIAFIRSASEPRISVVDLRRGVLLTHLELAGRPTQMLLKR